MRIEYLPLRMFPLKPQFVRDLPLPRFPQVTGQCSTFLSGSSLVGHGTRPEELDCAEKRVSSGSTLPVMDFPTYHHDTVTIISNQIMTYHIITHISIISCHIIACYIMLYHIISIKIFHYRVIIVLPYSVVLRV